MPFFGNKEFRVRVVGESHYEENLRELCGPAQDHMRQFAKRAILTLEDENPYDANAVRVDVEGLTVGHMSRSDAIRFRRRPGVQTGRQFACDAVLISLAGGDICDYGVRLEMDL